jgi:phospholipid/cholesterol/gamma-HCH transport system ATP-binding protein
MQIELQELTFKYGAQVVLAKVNFLLKSQQRTVLMGPSGQGKTTLLKILAGLLQPQSGQVLVDGKVLASQPRDKQMQWRRKVGMLFQKNALFDSLSCSNNVAFPMRETTNLAESEIIERVDYFLDSVGLSHAKNLLPHEISGGMQKRLGIARALALDPLLCLYDDPTAGLDPITSRSIIELIIQYQKKNASSLVAVVNDVNRAFQLATDIFFVFNQQIIYTGNPQQTQVHPDLRVQQFIQGLASGPLSEAL